MSHKPQNVSATQTLTFVTFACPMAARFPRHNPGFSLKQNKAKKKLNSALANFFATNITFFRNKCLILHMISMDTF